MNRSRSCPLDVLQLAFVALLAAPGCAGDSGTGDESARGEGDSSASPAAVAKMGTLSEEEFKALHTLKEGSPPLLAGESVEIDGTRAYLSLPAGDAPHPAVIVIHEWWGLNDNIRYWADRLAADGYAALAIDLYGGRVATSRDSAMAYMQSVDGEKATRVVRAAHDFVTSDPRIAATRTASIGWCFGGGWSLRTALANPDLDACVIYYGEVPESAEELEGLGAAVCGVFAKQDGWITPAKVDAFDAALDEIGLEHEMHLYDAKHAFANPSSADYHFEAAEDAWNHVRGFLAKQLKG